MWLAADKQRSGVSESQLKFGCQPDVACRRQQLGGIPLVHEPGGRDCRISSIAAFMLAKSAGGGLPSWWEIAKAVGKLPRQVGDCRAGGRDCGGPPVSTFMLALSAPAESVLAKVFTKPRHPQHAQHLERGMRTFAAALPAPAGSACLSLRPAAGGVLRKLRPSYRGANL